MSFVHVYMFKLVTCRFSSTIYYNVYMGPEPEINLMNWTELNWIELNWIMNLKKYAWQNLNTVSIDKMGKVLRKYNIKHWWIGDECRFVFEGHMW